MFLKKFAVAVKNNPKKSVLAAVVVGFTGKWLNKKYNAHVFRRVHCEKAQQFGKAPLHHLKNAKRLTVFLNPAANNGKASKIYEDYAAPILHLAGFDVHVIKLKYEGEAKKLVAVLDDTDMIVAAGGDGTLGELVTGLLRRTDKMWTRVPIGIIPLGASNTICKRLHHKSAQQNQQQFVCDAAASLIEGTTCSADVMKIEAATGKTVYALSDIRWGTYADLQEKSKKYWYFGRLKSYIPFIFTPLKGSWPKLKSFHVSYTEPEDAPSPEEEVQKNGIKIQQNTISMSSLLSSIFLRFWPWRQSTEKIEKSDNIEDNFKSVNNVEQYWHDVRIESAEFVAAANTHLNKNSASRKKPSMNLSFESASVPYSDFVSKGPFTVGSIQHSPVSLSESLEAHKFKLAASEKDKIKPEYFTIDNDRFEAMDIDVQLIPNCIQMVCSN